MGQSTKEPRIIQLSKKFLKKKFIQRLHPDNFSKCGPI